MNEKNSTSVLFKSNKKSVNEIDENLNIANPEEVYI